nr:hypothetical protein [uncultured Hyphomonas sp.]
MTGFKSIILHIGTEKTGTSAIQSFLRMNARVLSREGVIYTDGLDRTGGSQWEFVGIAHKVPWEIDVGRGLGLGTTEDQAKLREQLTRVLDREAVKASGTDHLLISSEHFHSRLRRPAEIASLKSFLENWTASFRIIVYFRRQDRVQVGLLSTRAKSGETKLTPLIPGTREGPAYYFSYDQIYDRWATVFGEESVCAGLYEDAVEAHGSIVGDFCERIGISLEGKVEPQYVNQSLSREGVHFLLALNALIEEKKIDISSETRRVLVNEITSLYEGNFYPINRQQARDFYNRFSESNETLRMRVFPDRPAPLFDEKFSQYPVDIPNGELDFKDGVAMAVNLWLASSGGKEVTPKLSDVLKRIARRL